MTQAQANERMADTKIVGRVDRIWSTGGCDSTPIFEHDLHAFNSNGLKRHMLELLTDADPTDTFKYQLYTPDGMVDCTLTELYQAVTN